GTRDSCFRQAAIASPTQFGYGWPGRLLHKIMSPLVFGAIFFAGVTPTGWIMRLRGRRWLLHRQCGRRLHRHDYDYKLARDWNARLTYRFTHRQTKTNSANSNAVMLAVKHDMTIRHDDR